MNNEVTKNSQLLTTKPKTNKQTNKQTKGKKQSQQIIRTKTESQKWRSHGGLSVGEWEEERDNKKHKWQVQNRQEEVKNNIGNVDAKELICMTHGQELR